MAVTLSANYLAELAKGLNKPDTVVEVVLDGGTSKFGYAAGNSFTDVRTCLKSVSSYENKLDTERGFSTLGTRTFVLKGRDNFKTMIQDERLKNRRVYIKEGFITSTFAYSDYAAIFTGKILNWTRKGDELTVTVADDMRDGTKKIPVENLTGTQAFEFNNKNPVTIMTDILTTESSLLGIAGSLVDTAAFTSELNTWLVGWAFHRVITEPTEARELLKELQEQSNSFIFHDGEKISFKVFAPLTPGQTVKSYDDTYHLSNISMESGSKGLINRVIVAYDWNEDGDELKDYDSVVIAEDASSQSSGEWDETKTRTIKSKWIRSLRWVQPPTNLTAAVTIYYASKANGEGTGVLYYNATNNTLQWTAPSGTAGAAVDVGKDGKFDLYDADTTKFIRVVVTTASLPGTTNDVIALTAMPGSTFATALANKILNRFRDPVATIKASMDMNHAVDNSKPLYPTRVFDITTDEACVFGNDTFSAEQMMVTKVKPRGFSVDLELFQTKLQYNYGFIGAAAIVNDWDAATDAEKEYAYISDGSGFLGAANDQGFLII